jgi:hypothetical protein
MQKINDKQYCKMGLMAGLAFGQDESDYNNRLCALELLANDLIQPVTFNDSLDMANDYFISIGGFCDNCSLVKSCIVCKFES